MESSPTEIPAKRKKNSLCAFFRNTWLAVKSTNQCRRQGSKVAPLQPVSDTDSADSQCAPPSLQPTARWHLADPQPDLSVLEATALQDQTDPLPGSSSVTPTNCDPNPADSEPAEENQKNRKKKKHIYAFFKRTWQAVKHATKRSKKHRVAPLYPQPDTYSAEPQPDLSVLESTALQDPVDPHPDLSVLESTALQEPVDPQPDLSVLESTALQDPVDPHPDLSVLESTALQDPVDPHPDLSVLESTALQDPVDPQSDLSVLESTALQDPVDPQPDPTILNSGALQDLMDPPEDPQPGSSDPNRDPDASKMTAVVGESSFVPAGLQDPADPLPSDLEPAAPKFPGASKHRRIGDRTRFRAACFTDPTPVPFDEIYEVERKIGEGGFGTVYKGISKFLREQVTIKIIPKRDGDRFIEIPGCSKPLFAEVALNLLLKRPPLSPYIVHMLEWFEEDDRFILILEYLHPCKDLLKFMLNNMQLLDESQTRSLMYQAVLGAKHCLDRGVFHRDIKLNNFLINTKTNQVKLIDFGCGDLVKSSGYLGDFTGGVRPPEYYVNFKYEAGPTTVWSLGFMIYSMVYKRQPFKSLRDMMHGSLRFKHKISTELQDLIIRCMTRDPTERATVEEILQHEWFQQGQVSGVAQDQVVTDAPNRPQ
ncbi:aurora kinase A-like isoform X3 [Cyprinus carpio]|uniref:non-specific serine/threonine protein kinase n=1 Tax=Cyprinus carpio TaxID=7962 RepID=A0A9Q9VP23_CYPCA|nr:aurora kinase A-like isoform X3 [Cyprinus carpio]